MDLVLHPQTAEAVEDFLRRPSHALLLSAPLGSGKYSLALNIAAQLLGMTTAKLQNYPYFSTLEPTDGSIPIEAVRELKSVLQLKTTGDLPIRRVLVIDHADAMTREAQNALLKILEEPPKDTVIILTADSPKLLLPTIASRVRPITVHKPGKETILANLKHLGTSEEILKNYHMSGGRIGLLHALLNKEEIHPLVEYIELAKNIIKMPVYERLLLVNEIANKDVQMLLGALYSVSHAALIAASENWQPNQVKRWYQICQTIYKVQQQSSYKPSSKLLLTHLFLGL